MRYDQEGDYFEIIVDPPRDTSFKEIEKDCTHIIDKKTEDVVGYAIFNFTNRKQKFIELQLPLPQHV